MRLRFRVGLTFGQVHYTLKLQIAALFHGLKVRVRTKCSENTSILKECWIKQLFQLLQAPGSSGANCSHWHVHFSGDVLIAGLIEIQPGQQHAASVGESSQTCSNRVRLGKLLGLLVRPVFIHDELLIEVFELGYFLLQALDTISLAGGDHSQPSADGTFAADSIQLLIEGKERRLKDIGGLVP